jgi:hypothetical protein
MKTMKKSMFIAAMAAMVLAGCTKDESIVEQQEIGFQPLAYKASQTKTETTTQPTTDNVITDAFYPTNGPSFGLFAYQLDGVSQGTFDANKADAKLYIDNKPVKYTSNYWRTDPKSFWPLQGSLTFIAYSPFGVSASHRINEITTNEGATKLSSVLKITDFLAGTEEQKDLMWSNLSKDKTSNGSVNNYPEASPTYAGVPILFNHALCRIKITAKTAEDYSGFATYNLKQIQVVGLKDKATLTVTDDVAEWSVAPSTTLADFDFYNDDQLLTKDSGPVIYKNAETAENGLLAIPQSLNGVQLLVTYTMTVDPNGQVADDEVVTETTKVVTLFKDDVLETLDQNKVYTLNLSISANEILYSPDVNDWEVGYNHDQNGTTPDVNYGGDYVVPQQ